MLQQTLKGMQDKLMQSKKQQAQDADKIKDLTIKLNVTTKEESDENEVIMLDKDDEVHEDQSSPKPLFSACSIVPISQKEAKLIGIYFSLFCGLFKFEEAVF